MGGVDREIKSNKNYYSYALRADTEGMVGWSAVFLLLDCCCGSFVAATTTRKSKDMFTGRNRSSENPETSFLCSWKTTTADEIWRRVGPPLLPLTKSTRNLQRPQFQKSIHITSGHQDQEHLIRSSDE